MFLVLLKILKTNKIYIYTYMTIVYI